MKTAAKTTAFSAFILLGLLGASSARAATTWSWSYAPPVLNVATDSDLYVTVTNDAGSDSSIAVENIDPFGFGDFGLLYEPGNTGPIFPTMLSIDQELAPGESGQFLAITFNLQPSSLPTPGVVYTINPGLIVEVGANCNKFGGDGCQQAMEVASKPLEITYAPVPEPSTLLELMTGLMVLGGTAAWMRRQKPQALQRTRP